MMSGNFWDKGIQLVDGCTHESGGCRNCWSEAMTARFKRVPEVITNGKFNGTVKFNLHLLEKAAKVKKPHVYAIWNDLYHEGVTDEQVRQAYYIMHHRPYDTFLIITKRIERFSKIFYKPMKGWSLPNNIWHIVTMESQAMVDKRMPHLLQIPGKRGVIVEPMLEAVDLTKWLYQLDCKYKECDGTCSGPQLTPECHAYVNCPENKPFIHQIIFGPENGQNKRRYEEVWGEHLFRQCEAAGVICYDKANETGVLEWR